MPTKITHRLRLACIASAALLLSASAAGAQTFGFNIMDMDRANGSPWHGQTSYVFKSEDGDARKSITVTALSLRGAAGATALAEGYDSAGSIGVLTPGDDESKVYLLEALQIRLGQSATQVNLTVKDLHDLKRHVLWTVSGRDATGRIVSISGSIQGRGVPNDASETFTIDQAQLKSAPGQPAGGFTGPVAITEITLSSLGEGATLPQFGNNFFFQSFYLVGVEASVGAEDDDNDDDDDDDDNQDADS